MGVSKVSSKTTLVAKAGNAKETVQGLDGDLEVSGGRMPGRLWVGKTSKLCMIQGLILQATATYPVQHNLHTHDKTKQKES